MSAVIAPRQGPARPPDRRGSSSLAVCSPAAGALSPAPPPRAIFQPGRDVAAAGPAQVSTVGHRRRRRTPAACGAPSPRLLVAVPLRREGQLPPAILTFPAAPLSGSGTWSPTARCPVRAVFLVKNRKTQGVVAVTESAVGRLPSYPSLSRSADARKVLLAVPRDLYRYGCTGTSTSGAPVG